MTSGIDKFLRKLGDKDYARVMQAIAHIMAREYDKLDTKPLVGHKNMFRVRVGRVRIIFVDKGDDPEVMSILNRDDKTYKNL